MDIRYYRKCKQIERLQGSFKHRTYNLLEHQYMVAVLFRHFALTESIEYDLEVFDMVMHHDILEAETTDLIYTVKNINQATKSAWEIIEGEVLAKNFQLKEFTDEKFKEKMTAEQHRMFKACDILDLWIFCKEEQAIGNKSIGIHEVIGRCEELVYGRFKFDSVIEFMENYEF